MGENKKILIIEDNIHYATVLHHTLGKNGFDVRFAEDGNRGLEKALSEKPDLILLDLLMPGIDGISLLKQIKNDSSLCDVPVMILTSCDEQQSKHIAEEAKADAFMNKTAEPEVIVAEIHSLLEKKTSQG